MNYFSTIGLDIARFERELRDRLYAKRVEQDVQSGRKSGVTDTPTFFVNGSRQEDAGIVNRLVLGLAHV